VHLRVREKKEKSLAYEFVFRQVNDPARVEVARGALTVVCVTKDVQTGQMRAVAIPEAITAQIEVAPAEKD
jgi:hypothetical protein